VGPSDQSLFIPTRCPFQQEKQVGFLFCGGNPARHPGLGGGLSAGNLQDHPRLVEPLRRFAGPAAALNTIVGEKKAPNVTFALALFAITPVVCLAVAKIVGIEGA
jgi:hypothetical protein